MRNCIQEYPWNGALNSRNGESDTKKRTYERKNAIIVQNRFSNSAAACVTILSVRIKPMTKNRINPMSNVKLGAAL